MKNPFYIFILSLSLLTVGCGDDDTVDTTEIVLEDAEGISETGFVARWTVTGPALKKVEIQLSHESSFNNILITEEVTNPEATSFKVEDLRGATEYYFRIKGEEDDANSSVIYSNSKKVVTAYRTESVLLTTDDGVKLSGQLNYLSSKPNGQPGLVFMHGYRALTNHWSNTTVFRDLVAKGYVCLTFYFRGHGTSDNWSLPEVGSGRDCKPMEDYTQICINDVQAAIEYMRDNARVDSSKIGLLGSSFGAVGALNGSMENGVQGVVAMSPNELGLTKGVQFENCFFVAGELDSFIGCEDDRFEIGPICTSLYNKSNEPKMLFIASNSAAHGSDLHSVSGVDDLILDWIEERLGL